MPTSVVIVLTTVPSADAGATIASALVEERLAACVSQLPPMTSTYRWRGAVTCDVEQQLVIKTTTDRLPAVRERLLALHPYDVPECLVVPVIDGSPAYLDWVRQETA